MGNARSRGRMQRSFSMADNVGYLRHKVKVGQFQPQRPWVRCSLFHGNRIGEIGLAAAFDLDTWAGFIFRFPMSSLLTIFRELRTRAAAIRRATPSWHLTITLHTSVCRAGGRVDLGEFAEHSKPVEISSSRERFDEL